MEIINQVSLIIRVNLWMLEVRRENVIEEKCSSLKVFVYNYAMEDYGTVKVETILDIMKVMNYSMKQGKVKSKR